MLSAGVPVRKPPPLTASAMRGSLVMAASLGSRIRAICHLRRDRVELALVRDRLALERLENDVDTLLEQLAVGILVGQRRPEALELAGVIAARHPEDHAATAQDVGHRIIFGEAQRMP